MKGFGFTSTFLAATSLIAPSVLAAVDPIVISGTKFFYKTNGTQFFIKGVAYQQDVTGNSSDGNTAYTDPLADPAGCQRDIPYLKQLQTNVIRVYAIDPTQDHSQCMEMLDAADIYVISDLSQPDESINRDEPSWNVELAQRYFSVVDAMANYTNVLGFFAGNEVSNAENNTDASAFVKAAVRDTKAYIAEKGYRTIGVGYATNDDATIRVDMADYFNCGNQSDAIDFWGYNVYSWCGDSSYSTSGYQARTEELSTYSIPAFFAEYGCNQVEPRIFSEVDALFGSQMTEVWSGGIVYMYFQEANDFGLVSVSGNTVKTLTDFDNLSSRIAGVTPTGTLSASYTPSNSPQACPTEGDSWDAAATPLPPTPNESACSCMLASLECVPKPNLSDEVVGELIGQVCGYGSQYCTGATGYGNNGSYGAWSMCNASQVLAWDMNQYYLGQNKAGTACDFGGNATTTSTSSPSGSCSSALSQAGTNGMGTVSSAPTAAGGAASSSSSGAASAVPIPPMTWGFIPMAVYIFAAVLSGAAMIIL